MMRAKLDDQGNLRGLRKPEPDWERTRASRGGVRPLRVRRRPAVVVELHDSTVGVSGLEPMLCAYRLPGSEMRYLANEKGLHPEPKKGLR
jgi:hypothetical protein